VQDRVRYILDYADRFGPEYSITSGVRTAAEQNVLRQTAGVFAVEPGCSQHEYALAVDVKFKRADWQEWYLASARNFGLITVRGDPVHVQGVSGGRFREWAVSQGLCPDPQYDPYRRDRSFSLFGEFCTTWTSTMFGNVCLDPQEYPDE